MFSLSTDSLTLYVVACKFRYIYAASASTVRNVSPDDRVVGHRQKATRVRTTQNKHALYDYCRIRNETDTIDLSLLLL